MRYVVIVSSPLLLFAGVVAAGLWLTSADDAAPVTLAPPPRVEAVRQLAVDLAAKVPQPPAHGPLPTAVSTEPRVPHGLEAPLRAVAADVNLCVPHSLERDLGPIDVTVRFTPSRSGAFAPGVVVTSTWDDAQVESCIAEVFEEATFWPQPDGDFRPSEFTFHFPDDAHRGLLGMRFVR